MNPNGRSQFKSQIYEQFANVGKAFGNAHRLEIIDLLSQAPHTVEELSHKTGMSIASTSQHLQVLRGAKLVLVQRDGTYMWYRLAGDDVFRIWQAMREFALSQVAEIKQLHQDYHEAREQLEVITAEQLLQRLKDDEVIILDVRPKDEFEAGHLPDAINIPLEELEASLCELPEGAHIVAYCRASYCLLSDEAAQILQSRGFTVEVYKEGYPEWRLRGLPTEISHPDT